MKFALKKGNKKEKGTEGKKEGRKKGKESFKIFLYGYLIFDNLLLTDVNTLSRV